MIGRTVSHYKIVEQLGEGGMGIVFKAEDTKLKRTVALKFLPLQLLASDDEKERFINEAQTAAALNHPNICTIYEINSADDQTFISMEYIPGVDLEKHLDGKPLEPNRAAAIAMELCGAVKEAHSQDIIHRDIKPANIMMSEKGRPVLLDFGLAKLRSQSKISRVGKTVGTATYMSPEQIRGEKADQRSDVWSLGVVLYQMLTGRPPFVAEHEAAVIYSIINEDPEPISKAHPNVPEKLERAVNKALAKNREDRYQNVDAFQADLEVFLGVQGASETPTSVTIDVTEPRRNRIGRGVGIALVIIIAAIIVWLWPKTTQKNGPNPATNRTTPKTLAEARDNSIAVLPLTNLSKDPGNEFFVDGMTEELITQLAQIKALKVISRTSVMRYKDSDKTMTAIADELGVAKVIEGAVLWAGDQVRITVQLVDGKTDEHIWANSYQSEVVDVLGLQRRVAMDVATQIEVELTEYDETRLSDSPVVDREAYELYLQGRFNWNKRTEESLYKAVDLFEKAIEIDPGYALAYAGLAETFTVLNTWGTNIGVEGYYPKAREMAEKAIELDEKLAPAHAVLGAVANEYDFDWDAAERHFLRAIELSPNYATAHQWYSEFLSSTGRLDEAVARIRIAMELDPLSPIIRVVAGLILVRNGEIDAGFAEFDEVAAESPLFPPLHYTKQFALLCTGQLEEAARSGIRYGELVAATTEQRDDVRALAEALETGGFEAYQRLLLDQLKKAYSEKHGSPIGIAGSFALIGEADSAVVWLERAIDQKANQTSSLNRDCSFAPIADNPRFKELLNEINIEYSPLR